MSLSLINRKFSLAVFPKKTLLERIFNEVNFTSPFKERFHSYSNRLDLAPSISARELPRNSQRRCRHPASAKDTPRQRQREFASNQQSPRTHTDLGNPHTSINARESPMRFSASLHPTSKFLGHTRTLANSTHPSMRENCPRNSRRRCRHPASAKDTPRQRNPHTSTNAQESPMRFSASLHPVSNRLGLIRTLAIPTHQPMRENRPCDSQRACIQPAIA